MTKRILFDFDNTLILFDEVKFFKAYIKKVAPIMSDIVSSYALWQGVNPDYTGPLVQLREILPGTGTTSNNCLTIVMILIKT